MKQKFIAENDSKRSEFLYSFLNNKKYNNFDIGRSTIPKTIILYWHNLNELPFDVLECIESWKILEKQGFEFKLFDNDSAKIFIRENLDSECLKAYLNCHHPAMRCDYFRLCYLYICGGFYVDCDEYLLTSDLNNLFDNDYIKLQPLCYSVEQNSMVENESYITDPYDPSRTYYFNNNPIISPPRHDLILIALKRSTKKLLYDKDLSDIQSITGPGNISAALTYYLLKGHVEIDIIKQWNLISETRWPLSYRNDDRNWRIYNPSQKKWFE